MLSRDIKLKLFKSLVLPHFIYGAEFLLNASARSIDRLRVALNSCVRYVFNLSRFSSVRHLQNQLLGCSLKDFLKMRTVLTVFKIINFSSPNYLYEKLQLFRSSRARNLIIPRYNTLRSEHTCLWGVLLFGTCYQLRLNKILHCLDFGEIALPSIIGRFSKIK